MPAWAPCQPAIGTVAGHVLGDHHGGGQVQFHAAVLLGDGDAGEAQFRRFAQACQRRRRARGAGWLPGWGRLPCPRIRPPCGAMARCSAVRSSGVKISLGRRSSIRNAPPWFWVMNRLLLLPYEFSVLHCIHPFENSGGALAAAHAHGHHAVLRIAALHLAQDGGGELGAGAAQRMAQRDGAAVHIDFLRIEAGLLDHRQRLHGECLVQFDDADVVELQAGDLRAPWESPPPVRCP